jgi:hypothetical protein
MTDNRHEGEQAAPRDASEVLEDDPKIFVLSRELSEIHLLLDNLSADPDTTIDALSSREPPEGLPRDWIERVCRVSWPPPDNDVTKAEQASLLIRAKDYLNRLARPASGATVAFTILVTSDDDGSDPPPPRRPGPDIGETQSRASLAQIAFPDYEAKARRFRRIQWRINLILLLWLVFTCFTSWYVAFGNSTLGEYAAAQKRLVEAQTAVANAEAGRRPTAAQGDPGAGPPTGRPAAPAAGAAAAPAPEIGWCNRWRPVRSPSGARVREFQSAEQLQVCGELERAQERVAQAETRLTRWLSVWKWLIGGGGGSGDAAAVAAHLTTIIGTAVLPVLYGFLGSGAAVLRSISRRIRTSTLSPRDLSLSLQQLALGALVGACIGLFIASPGSDQALIGPVALSVSAVSFIAGFGVEAVFQALEALIGRIFNSAPQERCKCPGR